jgi:hypothetical protein
METPGIRYLGAEVARFLDEEKKMAFIAGPRQVGKTTFAKKLLADASASELYFNWDIESHRRQIIRHPENFWKLTEHHGQHPRVGLDEIHKYPRWKRFVKGLYDEHGASLQIIVTGSGRLDIFQRGGDSLFGRYNLFRLHPFTLGEMLTPGRNPPLPPEQFWTSLRARAPSREAEEHLRRIERFTGFPEPLFAGSDSRVRRWRQAHRTLVLREDLRDLTRIRDIGLVESLALLLPERVGSPLSLNALSEDLNVTFATVRSWIEAMSRLYFLFRLKPYSGRLARSLRLAEKIYLYDFTEIENPGARFENLTALHLQKLVDAWTDFGYGEFDLYYVRDREKREVDFLITERRMPYALIEAKLSAKEIDPSIRYFRERLRPRYALQVIRNAESFKRTLTTDGVILTSAAEFFSLM